MPSPPRVLALIGEEPDGPTLWRVFWPFTALLAQGAHAWWVYNSDPRLLDILARVDTVLFPRMGWQAEYHRIARLWSKRAVQLGLTMLGEYDDDVFSPACVPQMELMIAAGGEDPALAVSDRRDRLFTLRLMHGLTVSTPYLASVVAQYTDAPIRVVPNAIDWWWWQSRLAAIPRTDPRLTIGWAGGRRLDQDLTAMATAWGHIAARFPHVHFRCAGYAAPPILRAVPADRLTITDWEPLTTYPRGYAHVDIGCCPLADVPFNYAKTPIKAYEWAAAGAAVVASPTVYATVLRPPQDSLLATTPTDWEEALVHLVTQPLTRQAMAARWAKRVREQHSLAVNLYRWPEAWSALAAQAPVHA